MITLAVDAMGGDSGLAVTVPGALAFLKQQQDVHLIMVGDESAVRQALSAANAPMERITVLHASEVVGMDEAPQLALKNKKDSSMRIAINQVKEGTAQAAVSAGNTGALMATSRFVLKTIPGIDRVIKALAEKIQNSGVKYDAMIAIGGGGFIPARMLRCFLEIPIYAVTTAYYDSDNEGQVTEEVKKVQWLDPVPDALKGKNVLVVDEVDDSRVTMEFCLTELQKEDFGTIGVAVLHEKIKAKVGKIPEGIPYFSGLTVEDWWINYPWDALDIDEHNRLAAEGKK